jgi:hypothetical protein
MRAIITTCEIGQSNTSPKSKTLETGSRKTTTAARAATGIRQHRMRIHMCFFVIG